MLPENKQETNSKANFSSDTSKRKNLRSILLLVMLGVAIVLGSGYFKKNSDFNQEEFVNLNDKLKRVENPDNSIEGIDYIRTSNYANQRLFYYYFIPDNRKKKDKDSSNILICIPALSGSGEKFGGRKNIKEFSKKEGFFIISPTFIWDKKNWTRRKSYQYPKNWSGDALIKVIERFKKKNGIKTSKNYIMGFSAGAQFAIRFAVWRPDVIVACAGHASGGWIRLDKFIPVKFFVTVGKWDKKRVGITYDFYHSAKILGIDVTMKTYDHSHRFSLQQEKDSLEFFKICALKANL